MSTTADEKIGPEHDQRLEHSPEYATKEQLEQYRLTDENAVEPGFWQTILKRGEYTAFYQEALDRYGEHAIDPLREARLKRKMDWIILPILAVCYFFYYVDKTTLSYAAIFGIREDLNLQGQEYAWLSSVFYFGWMAWAIPTNLIMQRSPPSTYLGINICFWGIFLMLQALSQNFTHMVVLRVLSGAAEAIADPAFMLVTAMWYTRGEQPTRISIWYAANGIGVAGGGLIGYGIGNIKGSLASWRYEFIIVGAFCTAWGIFIIFYLPNTIAGCRFISRDERMFMVARLRKNQTGIETKAGIKMDQLREFFMDPKSYLFFFLGLVGNIPNGGISNFSTLIIQGLGFDILETSLLGIPQGALVVIWIGAGAYLNTRLPNNSRTWVCMLFMIPTIAGALGFLLAPNEANVGRLICYYLTGSYQASFVIGLSLITSNVGGQTKKQLTSAIIFVGVCVGNIAGPFFFRSEQAPNYPLGIGAILVCNILEFFTFLAFRFLFIRANKRKEAERAQRKAEGVADANVTALADITDWENPNFVYVY
ncbi:major facilitator superfamily domain-containing protein [Pterulicium gracile]|uniref:Major facilitator superfamily domain-containing protein n=1 Tax=Pterulicium gracile TaxID=1884261 RepID=A0A5C3R2L1_9AGAR|nr:major facilitator superfamily domain-containing protein [Pterula gracilis]